MTYITIAVLTLVALCAMWYRNQSKRIVKIRIKDVDGECHTTKCRYSLALKLIQENPGKVEISCFVK
jgi:hypothetical protein